MQVVYLGSDPRKHCDGAGKDGAGVGRGAQTGGGPPTGALRDTRGTCLGAATLSARPSWSSRETQEVKEDAATSASVIFTPCLILSTLSPSRFPINTWESVFFNAYFCFSGIILIACVCMFRNPLGKIL